MYFTFILESQTDYNEPSPNLAHWRCHCGDSFQSQIYHNDVASYGGWKRPSPIRATVSLISSWMRP